MTTPVTPAAIPRGLVLNFDVRDFPVVEAEHFKPVIAETMGISLYPRKDGTLYVGRIQLRGAAAKKDGTPGNSAANLWLRPDSEPHKVPSWLLDLVNELVAPYLTAPSSTPDEAPTEAPADDEKPVSPMDVAGALSYLLTGHAASDRGPFAVHEGDGFHPEPYVMLPLDSMRKVLDRLPESTW